MLKMNEIEEIEVNPLILTDEGPVAVDGRVKIGP
jgi:succinyl-CoA synthetase beta subunit